MTQKTWTLKEWLAELQEQQAKYLAIQNPSSFHQDYLKDLEHAISVQKRRIIEAKMHNPNARNHQPIWPR